MPEWKITRTSGGTSVWLEGPRGADARAIAEAASRCGGVVAQAGDRYFDRPGAGARFLRPRHLVDPAQTISNRESASWRRPAAAAPWLPSRS